MNNDTINNINEALASGGLPDFLFSVLSMLKDKNVASIAQKSGINRESLYKMFKPSGNPTMDNTMRVLAACGVTLQITLIDPSKYKNKVSRKKSLLEASPYLSEQWHYAKNGSLSPNDIHLTSRKPVWWLCSRNSEHEWKETPLSRFNKSKNNFIKKEIFTEQALIQELKKGCPFCFF